MTTAELRTAAEEFWERFNAHDVSDSDKRVAPGFVNHNAAPGTPEGPEGLRQVAARLYEAFPDMRFDVEEVFTAEDRVAVLGWMNGTGGGQSSARFRRVARRFGRGRYTRFASTIGSASPSTSAVRDRRSPCCSSSAAFPAPAA